MKLIMITLIAMLMASCTSYTQKAQVLDSESIMFKEPIPLKKTVFVLKNGNKYLMLSSRNKSASGILTVAKIGQSNIAGIDFNQSGGHIDKALGDEESIRVDDMVIHYKIVEIDDILFEQFRVRYKLAICKL